MKNLWSAFVSWLAKGEINARLNALAMVFPEFTALLVQRMDTNAKASKAKADQKADLLRQVAVLDAQIKGHNDYEAACKLLQPIK